MKLRLQVIIVGLLTAFSVSGQNGQVVTIEPHVPGVTMLQGVDARGARFAFRNDTGFAIVALGVDVIEDGKNSTTYNLDTMTQPEWGGVQPGAIVYADVAGMAVSDGMVLRDIGQHHRATSALTIGISFLLLSNGEAWQSAPGIAVEWNTMLKAWRSQFSAARDHRSTAAVAASKSDEKAAGFVQTRLDMIHKLHPNEESRMIAAHAVASNAVHAVHVHPIPDDGSVVEVAHAAGPSYPTFWQITKLTGDTDVFATTGTYPLNAMVAVGIKVFKGLTPTNVGFAWSTAPVSTTDGYESYVYTTCQQGRDFRNMYEGFEQGQTVLTDTAEDFLPYHNIYSTINFPNPSASSQTSVLPNTTTLKTMTFYTMVDGVSDYASPKSVISDQSGLTTTLTYVEWWGLEHGSPVELAYDSLNIWEPRLLPGRGYPLSNTLIIDGCDNFSHTGTTRAVYLGDTVTIPTRVNANNPPSGITDIQAEVSGQQYFNGARIVTASTLASGPQACADNQIAIANTCYTTYIPSGEPYPTTLPAIPLPGGYAADCPVDYALSNDATVCSYSPAAAVPLAASVGFFQTGDAVSFFIDDNGYTTWNQANNPNAAYAALGANPPYLQVQYQVPGLYGGAFPGNWQPGDIPIVGDWTGDGYSKVGIMRPGVGWFLDSNNNGVFDSSDTSLGFYSQYAYNGIATPVIGKWAGAACDNVGLYFNNGTLRGYWIVDVSPQCNGTQPNFFYFGGAIGDIPLATNFVGSGADHPTVWRCYNPTGTACQGNNFLIDADVNGANGPFHADGTVFPFGGAPGDKIVSADWAGDGHRNVGIFRPSVLGGVGGSQGQWLLDVNGSHDTSQAPQNYFMGGPSTIPVVGVFK